VKGSRNPKEALELGLRIGVLDQTSTRGLAIASVARVARREVVIEMAVDVIEIEAMEIELVKVVRGAIGAQDEVGLKMLDPGEDHLLQVITGVLRHEDEAEVTGKMIEIGGAGTMGETAREYGALRIRTATTSDRGLPEAYEKHSALATTTSSYFFTLSGLYIIRGDLVIIVGIGTGAYGIYFKELGWHDAGKSTNNITPLLYYKTFHISKNHPAFSISSAWPRRGTTGSGYKTNHTERHSLHY
jgi:hypothetical protein